MNVSVKYFEINSFVFINGNIAYTKYLKHGDKINKWNSVGGFGVFVYITGNLVSIVK